MPTSTGASGVAVVYQEIFDSNGEQISMNPKTLKMSAKRTLLCPWLQRYDLIVNELYTAHPSLTATYALNFNVKPSGIAVSENEYVNAEVEIEYQSLDFIPGSTGTGVTISTETTSKVYTIPASAYAFSSGSSNASNALGKDVQITLTFANITMRRCNLVESSINQGGWVGIINNVNSAAMAIPGDITGYSYAAETLLYTGFDLEQRYVGATGQWLYNVSHKIIASYSGLSHNQELNPNTGNWETPTTKVGGKNKYPSADLSIL